MRVFLLFVLFITSLEAARISDISEPNVVVILCDDLGYGDVSANNSESRIQTPNMDRIASEGVRFRDAHASSSVCSPSRYALLTGRYNWRSRLQHDVLGGLSPYLIEPGRETIASLLKAKGYHTACVGKWHLGLDWVKVPGKQVTELMIETPDQVYNVDYSKPFARGPLTAGFDWYFGISGSLDMVPYTFLENDRVTVLPVPCNRTFPLHPGVFKPTTRKGPVAPGFEAEHVLPELTRQAVRYIEDRSRSNQPFFLYLPFASPHTPIAPTKEWIGKSGLNLYADFVLETDWAVGEVLAALDRTGNASNTMVIFTSDNGCSPLADINTLADKGHAVSGPLRGDKADIFDGGHRIPFFVRWPAKVRPAVSDQLLCLTDVFATCAEIVGAPVAPNAGEDSFSFLSVLLGKGASARDVIVHHSINGVFAIREGVWKLALCPGSGGWSAPRDVEALKKGLPETQLYKIGGDDIAEANNVYREHPELVRKMERQLQGIVDNGRSTPGPRQANAVSVVLRKQAALTLKE